MRARFLFVAAALSIVALEASASAADKCFPACRAGFVCSPQGTCVSACNPPCAGSDVCSNGECKSSSVPPAGGGGAGMSSDTPRTVATPAPAPSSTTASTAAQPDDPNNVTDPRLAALMGGFAFTFGNSTLSSTWGLTATLQFKTSGDHAFVIGPRISLMFASNFLTTTTFAALGGDLGYRGNFVKSKVAEAGVVALALPNATLGLTGGTLVTIPVTVGGFVHYKAFEAQAVLGGGPAIVIPSATGASSKVYGVGTFVINAGVAF